MIAELGGADMKDSETPERRSNNSRSDNSRRFQFGLRSLFAATTLLVFMLCMGQIFGLLVVGGVTFVVLYLIFCYRKPEYGISLLAVVVFISIFAPLFTGSPELGRRATCTSNFKVITLALLNYEADHGCFPPAYMADENGKPMHSWRVLILPYIERQDLYDAYRFDEPWDGPNNRKLHNVVIDLFKCPGDTEYRDQPTTSYVAVVGPHVAWAGERGRKWEEFSDGSQDTILLVETANSGIHWMEPRDLVVPLLAKIQKPPSNGKPGQGIVANHNGCTVVSFLDGHQSILELDAKPKDIKALLTIDGGEDTSELDW